MSTPIKDAMKTHTPGLAPWPTATDTTTDLSATADFHGSTATPEHNYAALSQTSRPVDAWLLRLHLDAVRARQQRVEETWPTVHRDQPMTETHSSPDPPTPPPIHPTQTTRRKRTHDQIIVDDEHGCRQTDSELGAGKADPRRARKRRMKDTGRAC